MLSRTFSRTRSISFVQLSAAAAALRSSQASSTSLRRRPRSLHFARRLRSPTTPHPAKNQGEVENHKTQTMPAMLRTARCLRWFPLADFGAFGSGSKRQSSRSSTGTGGGGSGASSSGGGGSGIKRKVAECGDSKMDWRTRYLKKRIFEHSALVVHVFVSSCVWVLLCARAGFVCPCCLCVLVCVCV
jgi:hypothetical protein